MSPPDSIPSDGGISVDGQASTDYSRLEEAIGVTLQNRQLLEVAFTHRSYLNENRGGIREHNERLEFFGDAVIEMVVTEHLYHELPKMKEGQLTTLRTALVRGKLLGEIGYRLGLGKYVKLSQGERRSGTSRGYLLACTFEALVGAIYLDQGYPTVRRFIGQTILMELPYILTEEQQDDPKSVLQALTQERFALTPNYNVISDEGPAHGKVYVMGILLEGRLIAKGTGTSKKRGEEAAAQNALESIKEWQSDFTPRPDDWRRTSNV